MWSRGLSEPPTVDLNYGIKIGDHERLKSETWRFVNIETLLYTLIFFYYMSVLQFPSQKL
jgi:hypothetical protein